ncbi:MAG TPA: signal peptide peptidase SppA [Lacipirellulaceae bacterium]|nr:signal peptide peptidase SppA [Lacipirellulaceae bacterium]
MAQDDTHPAPAPATAPQIIVQQRTAFGRFGRWLLAALVICVMIIISLYSSYHSYFSPADVPQEKYHSLSRTATNKIAIIEVSGTILSGEDSFAAKQIDRVRDDPDVVGVVLRINSPGGTITGSDYIYHHLRELVETRKLPMVVSMGSVCASGGYYVAMSVGSERDSIYAEPTTWTGSIGVIIPHFDISGGLSKLGIKEDSIVSGPLKEMGSPTRPMTDAERKILQALVDSGFKDFKQVVTSGRPKFKGNPAALDAVATGQVFTAKQALSNGLIDHIGFIDDAIARVAKLAGQTPDTVRCIKYEKRPTLLSSLVGATSHVPESATAQLSALLDMATPRAYYLWSWLPAAFSSSK